MVAMVNYINDVVVVGVSVTVVRRWKCQCMSTSDRSRHIHIRNNYVGQFVENGQIKVIHCPTKNMIADILTKPLGVSQFLYLRDYLLGYKIPAKGCVIGK